MELKQTKPERVDSRSGSALIMVVVLTVLLAVIGVLFVMASRIDEMATSSVVYDHELDHAVESVVALISQRLTDDLTGVAQEPWDYPDINDSWLSTIEPVSLGDNGTPGDYTDDDYMWRQVSDLTGSGLINRLAEIYSQADANDLVPADADGDGVTDSFWLRLPDVTTGRGRPVFAAVRIVDNCAMLNLNVAHTLAPGSEGRYLSEIDYERFLRGVVDRANPDFIRQARQPFVVPFDLPDAYHRNAIMHIENPGPDYILFDISDELEMRNRFMLTSSFHARFEREDVAFETFDWGRGFFQGGWQTELKVKRIPFTASDFNGWKWRLDPNNFDDTSGGALVDEWKYDRRHVCTFYSFDRNLRTGVYPTVDSAGNPVTMIFDPDPWTACTRIADWDATIPPGRYNYNNVETRVQILKLLYAFRAYYLEKYPSEDFKDAAKRAAQIVANMIDYVDDTDPLTQGPFFNVEYGNGSPMGQRNEDPTFIDRNVIWQLILDVSGIDIGDAWNINSTPYEFGLGVDDDPTDPGYPANREVVYGYERQPFISEICRKYDRNDPLIDYYAIELCNPYTNPNGAIDLNGWQIKIGSAVYPLASGILWQGALEVDPASIIAGSRVLGRAVIVSDVEIVNPPPPVPVILVAAMTIPDTEIVELQRSDPANPGEFITVDRTELAQAESLSDDNPLWQSSKRDDSGWKFANQAAYRNVNSGGSSTLGQPNNVNVNRPGSEGYQMPVADDNVPIGTLGDFEMVLTVGNEKGSDPNTVTEYVAAAAAASGEGEGDIRTDVAPAGSPYPLDYICFVGRPEGNLPGRININTATKEVIQAAIDPNSNWNPDYEVLANNIVNNRPFERVTDLLSVPGFDQFTANAVNGVGDPDIRDDFEERDWLLSKVANIFTVRSDVFTAYILVRLGRDGPERRMIAIFDRSNVSNNNPEKPRIIALHPVPDPR